MLYSLAVFHNHPESALIRLVMFAIRGKLTTWSAVAQIQPTSLPLFLLTTSYPSTQIFANAVFPSLQKLIHCFAMNELKMVSNRNQL